MSIGINEASITTELSTLSYCLIMIPVKVADIISINNHMILCLAREYTDESRYSSSDGARAFIFAKSSSFSSSIISSMSSIVIIPTSLFSLSVTGMEK